MLLAVLALGFWQLGLKKADMVILLATSSLAAVAVLAILVVSGVALASRSRWREAQHPAGGLRLEVDTRSWTAFRFPAVRIPFVEARWVWLHPHPADIECVAREGTLTEEVIPRRRGHTESIVRRLEIRDVLGVSSVRWSSEQPTPLQILPPRALLNESTLIQSLFEGDDFPDPGGEPQGDRVDMRRYTPGDPPRLILWKVYARTRKLMVRVPERAVVAQPRTCAYFVAGVGDEPCASLTRSILDRNLLGAGWRFGADGNTQTATEAEGALKILAKSGNPRRGPCGLPHYLEEARQDGYKSCLVIVPPQRGAWIESIREVIRSSRMRLTILTAAPSAETHRSRWKEALFYSEDRRVENPDAVLEELGSRNRKFLLYDVHSGTVMPDYRYRQLRKQVKTRS